MSKGGEVGEVEEVFVTVFQLPDVELGVTELSWCVRSVLSSKVLSLGV